jgi:hypothetical protein
MIKGILLMLAVIFTCCGAVGKASETRSVLKGRWVSLADKHSELIITDRYWIDEYNSSVKGKSRYYFYHGKRDSIVVVSGEDSLYYHVNHIDKDNLSLCFLGASAHNDFITIMNFVKSEKR